LIDHSTDTGGVADLPARLAAPGAAFRRLLARPQILQMPGAHNGLAALQARDAGFEALYLSGAAMSASMGLPDLGIVTIDDVCVFIRQVARAGLPVLVDGDTGFGGILNIVRMIESFEREGAAAVQIEDQLLPKKCGHLNDKKLASAEEMQARVRTAAAARRDIVIVARTDAVASEGFDAAVARAKLYVGAGADAIFPEALTDAGMFRAFAQALPGVPLLANMTEFGKTPMMPASEFEALGYRMVIWPVTSLRAAARVQEHVYATLKQAGTIEPMLPALQTRAELYRTIRYDSYEALDSTIARSILPSVQS
jgi:methylisocitrate lyase